jgi:hypothetical protein
MACTRYLGPKSIGGRHLALRVSIARPSGGLLADLFAEVSITGRSYTSLTKKA